MIARIRSAARESMRRKRLSNPDHIREINEKHRAKPESRSRAAEVSRKWHKDNREYANEGRVMRKQKERAVKPWVSLVHGAKSRARKKNVAFGLTIDWAANRWTGRCDLTGIEFVTGLRGPGAKLLSPSIDRIDPSKGYVPENCRIIIWCVNAFKYDGADHQMISVAEKLLRNLGYHVTAPDIAE